MQNFECIPHLNIHRPHNRCYTMNTETHFFTFINNIQNNITNMWFQSLCNDNLPPVSNGYLYIPAIRRYTNPLQARMSSFFCNVINPRNRSSPVSKSEPFSIFISSLFFKKCIMSSDTPGVNLKFGIHLFKVFTEGNGNPKDNQKCITSRHKRI